MAAMAATAGTQHCAPRAIGAAAAGSSASCVITEFARSPGDAPEIDGLVVIPEGDGLAPGDFVRVRITDCDVHDLYAERIE